MSSTNKGYLAKYGADLIDAGYYIIPIKKGEKRPPFTAWEKIRADHAQLTDWIDDGYGSCGVGIIASDTPAIDLDIRDKAVAQQMERWIHENIADAPVRIGNPPKRLLMFKTDEPFRKMKSSVFVDEFDDEHAVEILGDGQQFVAYHVHPDTNEPYQWNGNGDPLTVDYDDLPTLTIATARLVLDEFERIAEERGWKVKKKTSNLPALSRRSRQDDDEDYFAADAQKTDIGDDELHAKLLLVPGAEDYDTWLQIGMALYHQYDGDEQGLDLWHEWSSTADNYEADALDDKWRTFNIASKGRAPVTARLIIKLAKEAAEQAATETAAELTKALRTAETLPELKIAATEVKSAELDAPTREQIVGVLRQRFKAITGQPLGVRVARDMVRYENQESKETPRWLKDWVYLKGEDKFFNLTSRESISQTAFNTAYSRFMLTKKDVLEGRAHPERLPSHVATNINQIPVVSGKRYLPGQDELFTMNGVQYANTYSNCNVPEVPDELSKKDLRNIERVQRHFTHLFDEYEARILLDFIAYIVQNPDKRLRWALLLQGTEEDGKSFFGMLLGVVLGAENVRSLNAKTIQGDFNGWAEGQQVVFVEEIRLHGHNRFDVLNQVKPLITNSVIDIHRKGVDPYNVPNTASYILTTNYRDALPLTENDSRYFVMFSRFQTKIALMKFKMQEPNYYRDLYLTLEESPGALRGWLLDHEVGPEVLSSDRAPASRAKGYMAMLSKSEEQQAIEEILATSLRFDLSRTLLSATDLADAMIDLDLPEIPQTSRVTKLLTDMGFTYLGKFRVDGRYRRFWSQEPERFMDAGQIDGDRIRDWLNMNL